jgi:hypothetical protein
MENVDWDKWDKLADTSDVEAHVDPSIYSEAAEEAEQFEPESNRQMAASCEYPHVNEFGRKVPCPNPATRIAFRVDHSDPENPELHQSGIGFVCDQHAQQTHLTHEALKQSAVARAAETGASINLNRTTLHTPELNSVQDGLTEAGIRKGSTEELEAQTLMAHRLANNLVTHQGQPVPADYGLSSGRAITSGLGTDLSQFQEVEQPKELSAHGKFLQHEADKTRYQKQITDHNAGKHTVESYGQTVDNARSGNISQVCPSCLMKGNTNMAIRLAKRFGLNFGPLGIHTPHPADTAKEAEDKRQALATRNIVRKSYGLDPITDERGVGRPSTLESGDTGHFTVPVTPWSINQALPSGITGSGDPISYAARSREFDENGNLRTTKIVNGKEVEIKSPRVNIVNARQPYPAKSVAPTGRIWTPEVSPKRIERLQLSAAAPETGVVAFPMASDYQGTEEYADLDVRQHPYADPNLGTPIAWHNGRAVHVLREESRGGGTVWLPSEDVAMHHTSDCPNKDTYPYRNACKAGCKNLTHAEVRGATQASHIQAAESRRTANEQLEDLGGALRSRRANLQAKGLIRTLREMGVENVNDKEAVAAHLNSLGHDVTPEDIPDNLGDALEPTYAGEDIRDENARILAALATRTAAMSADELEAEFSRVSYPQTFRPTFERGKGLPPNSTFFTDIQAAKAKAQADAEAAKAAKKSIKKKVKKRSVSGRVKTRTASAEELDSARDAATGRRVAREVITRDDN